MEILGTPSPSSRCNPGQTQYKTLADSVELIEMSQEMRVELCGVRWLDTALGIRKRCQATAAQELKAGIGLSALETQWLEFAGPDGTSFPETGDETPEPRGL